MGKLLLKRVLYLIPILLGVSIITFILVHLVPVDPAQAYLTLANIPPTDKAIAATRTMLGLDKPLFVQYVTWLGRVLRLDFGISYATREPVLNELLYYLPATIKLTGASLLWVLAISLPLGFFSSLYKDSVLDHCCRLFAFIGASMPSFWVGFLLIYFFALKLNLLPVMGMGSIWHLILPSFTLALSYAATYTRLLRTSLLENLDQTFVLYARARGIRERLVMGRHVLKNALLPVMTAFGMSLGYMLAGSVIVENVFAWPGVGRYVISSIFNRDYPVIQCYALLTTLIFIAVNLLVDIAYGLIDPRIRMDGS